MSFTNTWDNTFPPDTQAANQLGADIRNLKTDIQQRMAAISGLDASKPAFEAGFAGVLYFATDTGKIFTWTGAAWTDITTDFITSVQATLVNMPFSATPIFDASTLSSIQAAFEMTLTADVTAGTMANITKGQVITFIIHQDGTGGHLFTWPGGVNNPSDIDPGASSINIQSFIVANDGVNLYPIGPLTVS
jgi:hypothetical protein